MGWISQSIFNPQYLLVSKAPVMCKYKNLKAYFQQDTINGHTNNATDWRKLSCCTAPNSQVLLMEPAWADSDWCNFRRMAEGDCPAILSHPGSLQQSQKVENNCTKISDHTGRTPEHREATLVTSTCTYLFYWWQLATLRLHQLLFYWWQLATLRLHQLLFSITR